MTGASTRSASQFFWLLLRPSATSVAIATAVVAFGVYLDRVYPAGFDQAVAIALFLQLFSASTGYRDRLRQGHFDSILAGRPGRWAVAFAHWAHSIALGASTWFTLGLVDLALGPGRWPTPLTAAGIAVMFYVSTVVWTVSLPTAQYAGGVLWLVLVVALASTQRLQALRLLFGAQGASCRETLQAALSGLVCPIFLMFDPARTDTVVVLFVLLATALAWIGGAVMIGRFRGVLTEG